MSFLSRGLLDGRSFAWSSSRRPNRFADGRFLENVADCKKGTQMAVKSAYADLCSTTLARVKGTWGKLSYVADRRSSEGCYEHWGFERTHATAQAQDAFQRVHRSLIEPILCTGLSLLREDLQESSAAEGIMPSSYVSRLCSEADRLLPPDCSKMTESHLIWLLKTLSLLESRREHGSQYASPFLQPDR